MSFLIILNRAERIIVTPYNTQALDFFLLSLIYPAMTVPMKEDERKDSAISFAIVEWE